MTPRIPFGRERGGKERKGRGRAPIRLLAQGPQHVNPALHDSILNRFRDITTLTLYVIRLPVTLRSPSFSKR